MEEFDRTNRYLDQREEDKPAIAAQKLAGRPGGEQVSYAHDMLIHERGELEREIDAYQKERGQRVKRIEAIDRFVTTAKQQLAEIDATLQQLAEIDATLQQLAEVRQA